MNILVTGGAGFIGSHVVDVFLKAGHGVRVLDFLGPPTHDGAPPPWLATNAELLVGDVRNKDDWRKALRGMDAVIHLAAYMDNHPDVSTYIRTNIESVALLFEVIAEDQLPIKKIIAASSQSVYGQGKYSCAQDGIVYPPPRSEEQLKNHEWEPRCPVCGGALTPLPELEDDTLLPQIPYGISKLASEQLLFNLGKRHNIPTVAFRFSIALGPRQSFRHFYSGALRSFAVNVLSDEPIRMNEDGMQMRDFVHVRDVASAYIKALSDSRADFQAFNVGSGEGTHVIDLARLVAEEASVPFRPILNNRYRVGDARYSLMDISKLKSLGWAAQYTLKDAVHEYLEWIRQFGNLKDVLANVEKQLGKEGVLKKV